MLNAIRWVFGVPQYASVGVPAGVSRRQWLLAVTLALLALGLLVFWLLWAREQGQESLATFQANLRGESLTLADRLTRTRETLAPGTVDTSVFLITPAYVQSTGQEKQLRQQFPDGTLAAMVSEDTHVSNELPAFQAPLLRTASGEELHPVATRLLTDSYHHRTTLVTYPEKDSKGRMVLDGKSVEMVFIQPDKDGSNVLHWDGPLTGATQAAAVQPLTIGVIMALFAGLLASMWPCLFQLTAYFIPTIAGLSMEQIEDKQVAVSARLRVVKTAVFFVLGFTIVYTTIGGLAGYAGSALGSMAWIDNLRRPISIIAGIVIIGMAIRVAVNARAPFVCKMPLGGLHSRKGTGPLGTMFTGLIFASGCMTCFGAALLVGLISYVGTSGSILMGAGLLFLFSLGIGIPLVIAAVAMARILPLLGRLEKVAPYLALASSVIMITFGVLMLTNHLHVISGLVYKGLPLG